MSDLEAIGLSYRPAEGLTLSLWKTYGKKKRKRKAPMTVQNRVIHIVFLIFLRVGDSFYPANICGPF
jgi:hypothetical protein